jgi:CubicO group peptidase (beta-lactamase class C family)
VFAEYDRTSSPGCALAIYRNGEIAYSRGYGMANLEHAIAITPRSVFDIGSTSKQFTAASIVLLALDGKLSIDDDVRKYLPELPAYQRPITIRMLLNHTSGLRDYLTLMYLQGVSFDGVTTDRDAYDVIVRQRAVNFDPGSEWLYSNSGFFLLSQIVKRVSGKTLAEFARERIFAPLGMTNTHFHDNHTLIVPLRATGYDPHDGGGFQIGMSGFEQTGDGAVMTTVQDLLRWDENFYKPTVGGERMLQELQTVGKLNDGKALQYALGLFVDEYRGLRRVSHGGAWAGYRAELMRFPTAHTSVTCLCNLGSSNPTSLAERVANVVLKDRLSPERAVAAAPGGNGNTTPAVALAPAQLQRLAGAYRTTTGATRTLTLVDGRLVADIAGRTPLIARDSLTFALEGVPVVLRFEMANGRVSRMMEEISGNTRNYDPFTPVSLTSTELAAYAGTFYAPELDHDLVVTATDSTLVLRPARGADSTVLRPTTRDAFAGTQGIAVTFTRDKRGAPTKMSVDAGRVRGITADRKR